ncbi:Uncharacterized protein BM_BM17433 [Brugia malayi]|uniref:Uncharacterized protein n=3 Tax=Brugia TaxID=6278 RepID=A0A4E9FD34_BRUMA|nr:Uncharacterized protein BM_BM17433 [Brugia malayi]VDN87090.1 unnamed protein product [Brugia pahangi]VIO92668.1 Uncharacterized protein BM_BM17433 [Brugia malayi]
MPNSILVPNSSFTSSTSSGSEIDYMQNIKAMLEKSSSQISRNGNSQLQRLINNIDNPEKTKPMKAVSLGELNTVDLHFIIVAILERRIITCEEQNDALKKSLKKALRKIAKLEDLIGNTEEPKENLKMLAHSKSTTS